MGKYEGSAVNYASVLESVPQPIAVCDSQGTVLYVNAMARQFLKLDEQADLPRFALADRETFSQLRIDTTGLLEEYYLADVEVEGAGRQRASMSLSPLDDECYRVLLEAAPRAMVVPILDELDALVAICDGRRRIRLANAALNQVMEAVGQEGEPDLLTLFQADDRSALRVCALKALAGGTPDEVEVGLVESRLPQGRNQLRVRIRPLGAEASKGQGGRSFLMVAQPGEASFSQLQEKFARVEELMSLGELATGVAHELKNPLTSMLNYAHYLMEKYRGEFEDGSDEERLQRIIDGVERIDSFVSDLLKLADADEMELAPLNLHKTLRASVQLSQRVIRDSGADVQWELDAKEPVIDGHPGGLKQVFSNLVLNAARALPDEGGQLTIRSREIDDQVHVEVEDSGCGMSTEVCDRIFEPFYSATPEDGGAGLGLALVRRLVEEHGGRIEVSSTPGEGTCFTIRLPA